jgi:hypothetical protein
MSAHRNSRKIATVATAAGLMAVAAFGGYAVAASHTSGASSLAEAANVTGSSGRNVTLHGCLTGGKLTSASTTARKCPAKSIAVQWTVQAAAAAAAKPQPSSAASSNPAPSSAPATAPSSVPSTMPSSQAASAPATTSSMPQSAPSTSTPSSPAAQSTACVTSSAGGSCGPYTFAGISGSGNDGGNAAKVIQNIWNPISGASQTLTAVSPGDWSVTANMPASNKAVVSYPDTQQIYTTHSNTPNPLSGYKSLTSSYSETSPGAGDYEAAYDIWANSGSQEIMIWVDNHGQTPAGSVVAQTTIDGVGYQIWSTSGPGSAGSPVSMVMNSNQPSGTVNLLDDLNWLESNGYMNAGSGLNQVDFGWEIASTGGTAEKFTLSQYGINATCTSGTACTE